MTARIIRRGFGQQHWHVAFWRVVLSGVALLVAWLLLASAAAAPPTGAELARRAGELQALRGSVHPP